MAYLNKKYIAVPQKLVIVGFGIISQAVLPLIFRHCEIHPSQITILTKDNTGLDIAQEFSVRLELKPLTEENYVTVLNEYLAEGDFLLNLSVDVSSIDLIKFCQKKRVLYLDTCTEPWVGVYTNNQLAPMHRTNYMLREALISLKSASDTTAVVTHGANPGLVSHFVKQALLDLALENNLSFNLPQCSWDWANLAYELNIKSIHIAERDTQITSKMKNNGEFVNTWSVNGFVSEGSQPAELGWGTHEKHWPNDARQHTQGSQCAIYLERPGASVRVRSWTPKLGPYHGYLITHAESVSISNFLTLKKEGQIYYRPTVHYAYRPCPDAVLSLNEFASNNWQPPKKQRLILAEIVDGYDELGVLLMGNKKGAYWYGSHLAITEARKLVCHNSATTLQVASGVLSGLIWALNNPSAGIVEPEELDYQFIMKIVSPYLGVLSGYYTDWTPLKQREILFKENIDHSDPWQFLNIRVE